MDPNDKKQLDVKVRPIIDDEEIINEEDYIDGLIAIFTSSNNLEEDDDVNDFLRDYE